MAYAAWAQVILTAIGVLLIWRTLFHTRVAAEAAKATVVEAEKSTRAAFQAAEATIKANEISRDAHIADQRPWVAAYVEIGGPATWDTSGFHLRFRFILENTGNTPAFKTEIRLKGIAFHEFSDLVKSQLIWANIVRNDPCHLGATLFPNQKKEFREFATITNDEIREALGLSPDEIFPKESNILPAVIGCANYHSVFGGTGHQTGLIFQIRSHAAEEGLVAIHGSEGEIPAEHLGIYAWPLDGRTD